MTFAGAEADRRVVAQDGSHGAALLVFDGLRGVGGDVERRVHDLGIAQQPQASTGGHLAAAVGFRQITGAQAGTVDPGFTQVQGAVNLRLAQYDHTVFFAGDQPGIGQ